MDGQTEGMPLASIGAYILQSIDVLPQLPPQIVFDLHVGEFCRDVEDLVLWQRAEARGGVDVQACHQTC